MIHWLTAIGAALSLLTLVGSSPSTEDADKASIRIAVRFLGPVPAPQEIVTTNGSTILHRELLVDGKTKGLKDVVAVLENSAVQPKLVGAKSLLMDQRDQVFVPRVMAVQYGQPIRFENNDAFNHSILTTSLVKANQLNVMAGPNQPVEHVFEPQKSGVQVGCALHPWMRAWIYVFAHPWFAVTDANGSAKIENVPPGRYTVWLRHPDTGLEERRNVVIEAGQSVEIAVEWNMAKN